MMQGKLIRFENGKAIYSFFAEDIVYVEKRGRNTLFVLMNDEKEIYLGFTMEEMMDKLDGRFRKCHRSYIINMDYIWCINSSEVLLRGGHNVAMGRECIQRTKQFLKAYNFEEKNKKNHE